MFSNKTKVKDVLKLNGQKVSVTFPDVWNELDGALVPNAYNGYTGILDFQGMSDNSASIHGEKSTLIISNVKRIKTIAKEK